MTDRAVSTVVDVAVCLLVVSAAVVTLAGAPTPSADPAAGTAAETASVLGSTTATVEYSLGPDLRRADGDVTFPVTDGPALSRSANGTLAGLLAAAAVGNLTADGVRLSHVGAGFRAAVRNATRPLVSGPDWRGQVIATWEPYRGSHLSGRVVVGPAPPSDVDVYTARLPVSTGFPAVGDEATATARDGGFAAVAATVADGVVAGLFPPERIRAQLQGPYPEGRLARLRYGEFASRYGVSPTGALDDRDVERANDRLRSAIADRVVTDLQAVFETPAAAANAVRLGTVTLTVRTWSP